MDAILCKYNKAGFRIKQFNCNREFEEMLVIIEDELDIELNYMATGEHVTEAKRNN